jgi:hypothetical protein
MTLVVGCQATGIKWTEAPNNDLVVKGGSSKSKVYTFNPPKVNNTNCVVGYFSVFNIENN